MRYFLDTAGMRFGAEARCSFLCAATAFSDGRWKLGDDPHTNAIFQSISQRNNVLSPTRSDMRHMQRLLITGFRDFGGSSGFKDTEHHHPRSHLEHSGAVRHEARRAAVDSGIEGFHQGIRIRSTTNPETHLEHGGAVRHEACRAAVDGGLEAALAHLLRRLLPPEGRQPLLRAAPGKGFSDLKPKSKGLMNSNPKAKGLVTSPPLS